MKKIFKSRHLSPWITALVVLGIITWSAGPIATKYVFDQTVQRGHTTLRLTVAGLKGALGQYRSLPQLIADNRNIQKLLTSPSPLSVANQVNRELKRINTAVQASDTYLLNNEGLTVAASNFDTDISFVGQNFSYRPYFQDAVAGKQGQFFALGTTSLKRGYYFASPVRVNASIVGVVTVKINIDAMESAWQSSVHEIIVTDENGIIFMSSRPDWRFKSIEPLTAATLKSLATTRKYDQARLTELEMKTAPPDSNLYKLVTVAAKNNSVEYLVQNELMQKQGWRVHIFSATAPARAQAYTIVAAVLFVLLSMLLAAAFVMQRRQRLFERINVQREARQELEKQVKVRTFDLNQANTKLIGEINERKATEQELRKTQADLVQAGKLAALGQMSAALSHEFNQPLGAAKSYADNAATFLDRGRMDDARDNITRISSLVDRMASIAKHLRNFARKPNEQMSVVPVATIISDAIELLDRRIKQAKASVSVNLPDDELWVDGGQVRLQQVLVNLINNGLDAMEITDSPKIEITAVRQSDYVVLTVRDFGSGIDDAAASQIFDPFFTTKGVGKGLGLGLSISYNIIKDFGGELSATNHPQGGAVFSIKLNAASNVTAESVQ